MMTLVGGVKTGVIQVVKMEKIGCFASILGAFFGVAMFVVYAIIENVTIAVPVGILGGLFFGVFLAIVMAGHNSRVEKRYLEYKDLNIKDDIIYEKPSSHLNNKNAGYLYLTKDTLFFVSIKMAHSQAIVTEIKIPLDSIESILPYFFMHRQGKGSLIIQKDGAETRLGADYNELKNNLLPFIRQAVFNKKFLIRYTYKM